MIVWLAALFLACGSGIVWATYRSAQTLITPASQASRMRILEVRSNPPSVVLPLSPETSARGNFALRLETGAHIRMGDVIASEDTVTRAVRASDLQTLRKATHGSWSGVVCDRPQDIGIVSEEIIVNSAAGGCPAWLVRGNSTWAIHVHGYGATRASPLRSLIQEGDLRNATSLFVSYRSDGDGPSKPSSLGFREVADVGSAIDYAVAHGATRVILVGWSMGGMISLLLHSSERWSHLIDGLILDSPVLDWMETLKANCKRRGYPTFFAQLICWWLSCRPLALLVGAEGAIPVRALSWSTRHRRITKPCLIIQGTQDTSTPVRTAQQVHNNNPATVTLKLFHAGHTTAWNSHTRTWTATVNAWLAQFSHSNR